MHKSTVSLALSGKGNISALTRTRIADAARELGYEPNPLAQRLAQGHRNDTVAIFTGVLDVGLSSEKLLRIQQTLSASGLEAPIHVSDHRQDGGATQAAQIRQLRRQRPRAIICATQRVDGRVLPELQTYIREGGVVVSYDTPIPLECDQVLFDREVNAYRAAHHLLERGHRKLGLGVSDQRPNHADGATDPVSARIRGFRRALQEFGLEPRPEWLFYNPTYERGGAEMAQRFLALKERPTALCIVNDYVAMAFMCEILRAGVRVPEDVSLMGHDNQPIARYCPVPLTSVSQPYEAIADAVAGLLLSRLQSADPSAEPPRTISLEGELIERSSVGPVQAG